VSSRSHISAVRATARSSMNPSTHRHSWDSSCSRVPWERLDASLRSDFMGEGCTFTKVSSYLLRHRATTGLLDTLVRIELRTLAQAGTVPIFEPCARRRF